MEKRKKPKKEQKMSIKGIGKAENKANESRLIKNNRSYYKLLKKVKKFCFFVACIIFAEIFGFFTCNE